MKNHGLRFGLVLGALVLGSCSGIGASLPDGLYAELDTAKGVVVISLAYREAPLTVANFVGLAEGTISQSAPKHYFDGLTFHRVVPGFVVQTGDPTGTGSGGPGYSIPDEIVPTFKHDAPGVVAMANRGPNTNGSQFYITTGAAAWLDGHYSIFGHVVRGIDVVQKLQKGDALKTVKIERVGTDAQNYKVDQASFDKLLADTNGRLQQQATQKASGDLATVESKWPKATALPDGLRYIVEKHGTGTKKPVQGNEVTINYVGTLLDGTKFDSSADSGQPLTFKVGQAIPGMNEAVTSMTKGEKRLVIIPPQLGYGDQGAGERVPPNSFLVFDLELVDFK